LLAIQKEPLPASPQEKEAYFMTQVSLGEQMAVQGESIHICIMIMEKPTVSLGAAFNLPSALAFYRALRVYPSPVELIMLYEKSVPPPVFKVRRSSRCD
jgi:import receptor subunit TOM20